MLFAPCSQYFLVWSKELAHRLGVLVACASLFAFWFWTKEIVHWLDVLVARFLPELVHRLDVLEAGFLVG
jgi:hypothetical protein